MQQLLGRYDEDVEAGVRYAAVLRRLKLPGIRSYFTIRPLPGPMLTTCELANVWSSVRPRPAVSSGAGGGYTGISCTAARPKPSSRPPNEENAPES